MSCIDLPARGASTAEVAERLKVGQRTVQGWIDRGLIRGYRVGPQKLIVDLDEVEQTMVGIRPPNTTQPDIVAAIEKIVAQAPPITTEQRQRLTQILGAAGGAR